MTNTLSVGKFASCRDREFNPALPVLFSPLKIAWKGEGIVLRFPSVVSGTGGGRETDCAASESYSCVYIKDPFKF